MKFWITGVDRVTGYDRQLEVEAESEKEALEKATAEGIMATSARASKKSMPRRKKRPSRPSPAVPESVAGPYIYKMVQIHLNLEVAGERGGEAAHHMQTAVNEWAERGWEFFRADSFNVVQAPGCLAIFGGVKEQVSRYYVLTFRRPHPRREV
ncbi:hypothetical protein Pan258_12510 [Symmachiella dynata]|uniref:hypothetical protein n=1 Tax=Symmachiella dynata TaxID=2527995 RepID=UPI001189FF79|nr:hypothetical protein [Symmachiella dynata]QDT47220.1 hypothetical protein Pan258_12510 [Symmachiella dynata]